MRIRRLSWRGTMLLVLLTLPSCLPAKKKEPVGADLATVIRIAEESVREAEEVRPGGFPELVSAEVSLNTTLSKGGEGKVKFLVFSLGGGTSRERSSTITLQLKKPQKTATALKSVDEKTWKQTLAQAIALAKESFTAAQKATTAMTTRKIEIEVAFTVKLSGSGGVDTAELLPIGLSLDGKIERSRVHTLKLTFGEE